MKPARLFFFLANNILSFSFQSYFARRCFNIVSASVFPIIIISIASGALIAYLSFILSARNPFGISIQRFLPFLFSSLIIEEICPSVAFFTVLGQCCISTGMELHSCSRRGELEILYIYKRDPVGIYLSPFIVASILLGTTACGCFIISSMSVISWMVYINEPGYFYINVGKYFSILQMNSITHVFVKTILFSMFSSVTAVYYAVTDYTKTEKFKVANVIAISTLLSRASDFLFYLFRT